jgi:DNA polymerase-3 subunit alpha (Gram-positive type)
VDVVFTSDEDLRGRSKISKTVIDVMREYGILEGLPETDQMTLF